MQNIGSKLYGYILSSEIARKVTLKYPNAARIILARTTVKRFAGLPLTFLALVLSINLLLVFDFTNDVINAKEFIVLDSFAARLLFVYRNNLVAESLYIVTRLCSTGTVAFIGSILVVFLIFKKYTNQATAIVVSLIGSGLTIYLSKRVFEIDRPHQFAFYTESSFSFPSGHTTIAVAFYGLVCYLLIRQIRSYKIRALIFSIGMFFILTIGFSRLYLCVHYLSDIIAGYLIGSLWMLLSISLFEWMEFKGDKALG
jgi:membrane-associated phospholipid phosphatase